MTQSRYYIDEKTKELSEYSLREIAEKMLDQQDEIDELKSAIEYVEGEVHELRSQL